MNKPLTITVKDTKTKILNVCSESGLPPVILDLIMQGVYSEIHSLAERYALEGEKTYMEAAENESKEDKANNEPVKE